MVAILFWPQCVDLFLKVTWIYVNIGSDIGLLPDGTEPLPESMMTYHQ